MGIEYIKRYTCDYCKAECGASDGFISVRLDDKVAEHLPVVAGELKLHIPYGISGGIICRGCKLKALRKYLEENT